MPDNIIDIERQFVPGFFFNFERVRREMLWDDWYNGQYNTLLPSASIANGRKFFGPQDLTERNVFRMISETHARAVLAEPPIWTTDSPRAEEWLNHYWELLYKHVELGAEHWSVKDYAVFVVFEDDDGKYSIDAINPSNYFRVGSKQDPDALVGHIIAQRYVEPTRSTLLNPQLITPPNRIRVFKYDERKEINTVQDFSYSGSFSSGEQGNPVSELKQGAIKAICTLGRGQSWYDDVRTLVADYMILETNIKIDMNRYRNAPQLFPPNTVPPNTAAPGERPLTVEERIERKLENLHPVIVAAADEGTKAPDPDGLARKPLIKESMAMLDKYDIDIQELTGTSPASRGFGQGKNQSSDAMERLQDPAASRAKGFRWEMAERCLVRLCAGLGCPDTDQLTFTWNTSPYENRIARNAEIREDARLGIISIPEASKRIYGSDLSSAPPTQQEEVN